MNSRLKLILVPLSALALSIAFMAPAGAATGTSPSSRLSVGGSIHLGASQGWNIPSGAAQQLNFSDSNRDTNVHVFPDIPWFEQRVPGFRIGGGQGSVAGFDAQTCTLGLDPTDTFSLQGQLNEDALAITGFGAYTDNAGKSITANLQLKSLNDGAGGKPTLAGSQDIWQVQWDFTAPGSSTPVTYFLSAAYPGTSGSIDQTSGLPVDFSGGYVSKTATGGSFYNGGAAATGSMNLNTGVIKITANFSDLEALAASAQSSGVNPPPGTPGAPAVGDALPNIQSNSEYLAGAGGTGFLEAGTTLKSQTATEYENGNSNADGDCPRLSTTVAGAPSPIPAPHAPAGPNLYHYGGPVAHHMHNYLIFWLPNQASAVTSGQLTNCAEPPGQPQFYEPGGQAGGDTNYETILQNFFHDLPGSSYYNLLSQYADEHNGAMTNDPVFAGPTSVYFDYCGYTSTQTVNGQTVTVPGGTDANPLFDVDIQNEVLRTIQQNHWPEGLGNEYFVFTGYDAASCMSPADVNNPAVPGCSVQGPVPGYCAYHGDFIDPATSTPVLYANMADGAFAGDPAGSTGLCYSSPINSGTEPTHQVNGQPVQDGFADAEVNITSHEMSETLTDPMVGTASLYGPPLGWYADPGDAGTGASTDGEIGDKCAYIYGQYNPADGSNIVLQGNDYIVQEEYSDWANGCALGGADGTTPYAGATNKVAVGQGWNLLAVTTAGINSSSDLVNDMSKSNLNSVGEVATFNGGIWNVSIPGYTDAQGLSRNQGAMVLNNGSAGTYAPTGVPYSSPPSPIQFGQGWNLIAPTWPNPGVETDSMYNELQAQNGSCTASNENPVCTQPVSDIAAMSGSGAYLDWKPAAPYSSSMTTCAGNSAMGTPCWFQTGGNSVPFTYGLWVDANQPLSWVPDGIECQSIDKNGMCK